MPDPEEPRLLRRPEVEARTAIGRATIYKKIADGTFPRPVKTGKRGVAWREADIAAWIISREGA